MTCPLIMRPVNLLGLWHSAWRDPEAYALFGSTASADFARGPDPGPRPGGGPPPSYGRAAVVPLAPAVEGRVGAAAKRLRALARATTALQRLIGDLTLDKRLLQAEVGNHWEA